MFINEYGNRSDPTVILLAPMMISGSDLYGEMSPFFQGAYHIIAPDQGGHGKAGAYISVDEEYRTLKNFLLETACTTIELVYGASMGVAVAYRLFMDPEFTVNHAWFDGVALKESAGFAEWFVSRMFRKRKKLSAKLQGKGFSSRTIWNIFWSANNYEVPKTAPQMDTKIPFWVGTDEWGSRFRDLKWAMKYLPQMEVVKIPHMMHGEFVMVHPNEFAERAFAFLLPEEQGL